MVIAGVGCRAGHAVAAIVRPNWMIASSLHGYNNFWRAGRLGFRVGRRRVSAFQSVGAYIALSESLQICIAAARRVLNTSDSAAQAFAGPTKREH